MCNGSNGVYVCNRGYVSNGSNGGYVCNGSNGGYVCMIVR